MRYPALRTFTLLAVLGIFLAGCAAQPAASSTAASPSTAASSIPAAASTQASTAAAAPSPASSNTSAASSSGTIRCVMVAGANQASYKVREQLARLSFPTDAVGTTSQVSGEIDISKDGTVDTGKSKFTVDLASLATDSGMRDNFVRRNVLQTDQYPQAVFVPKQVTGLAAPLPPSGDVSFKITGDMTLHGVTKTVTWDVTGTAQTGKATGTATTTFKFEDFNIQQPQVPVVLSVVDSITLSVTLNLQQS